MTNQANETDRLIHFLEYEINNRISAAKQPGWTTWAILGALASSLWLMLTVIEASATLSWSKMLFLFLLLSASFDFLLLISRIVSYNKENVIGSSSRFEHFDASIGESRLFIFGVFVRSLILVYIFQQNQLLFNPFIYISGYFFLVLNSIITGISLILSFLHLPFPKTPESKFKWFSRVFIFVWHGAGLITVIGLIVIVYDRQILVTIPEWKTGLLFFTMSLLLLIMVRSKHSSVLLNQLRDIHKKLSLDQIDSNAAIKQVDIIMNGLRLGDILQPEINDVLNILKTLKLNFENYSSEISVLEKYVDSPSDQLEKVDGTTINALIRSFTSRKDEIFITKQDLSKKKGKLKRKISFIYGAAHYLSPEIDKLYREIHDAENELNKVIDCSFEQFKKFEEKLNKSRAQPVGAVDQSHSGPIKKLN